MGGCALSAPSAALRVPIRQAESGPVELADAQGSGGYRMIKSFEAESFRSFRHLSLIGLPAVNILVGKSAAGKTTLLEAIRLALGATPQVAWQLNAVRGMVIGMPPNPTREQFEAAWKSYFPDFDLTKTITFKVTDSEGREARLEIFFDKERPVTPLVGAGGGPPRTADPHEHDYPAGIQAPVVRGRTQYA
jgi:hypothetical protein